MTAQQRRIGARGRIVMVGRDTGTVVLPDADLKIYLDATAQERAGRRCREMVARGELAEYEEVLAGVRRRDRIDSNRIHAPLRVAQDAVVIDTTRLTIGQVLARVLVAIDGWQAIG
jgi:cytidylate kinase